ncbi:MAG: hypothetical protein ACOC8F_06295 [Planctomycetota bacterium]
MPTCYRIRFRPAGGGAEREVVVDANSPTEALVKFRHIRGEGEQPRQQEQVHSVSPAAELSESNW